MLKIAYLGGRSLGGICLKHLARYPVNISIVVGHTQDSGKDTVWYESTLKIARELSLFIPNISKLRSPEATECFKEICPDLILNVFCDKIIPRQILEIPKLGAINFHYGMLPKYRGRFPTVHAILSNEKKVGVTAHYMIEKVDAGDIIRQEKVPVSETDTAKTLYMKCTEKAFEIFVWIMEKILKGESLPRTPQRGEASYFKFQIPNNGEIDWEWCSERILQFTRAMTFEPVSYAWFRLGNRKMVIVPEEFLTPKHNEPK